MTSEMSTAMSFLNTPIKQGDWTINIFVLDHAGQIGDELPALGRSILQWDLHLSEIGDGPLYSTGSYEDDDGEDEEDEDLEDEDDGSDLLSAALEDDSDDEDLADDDSNYDDEHYELSLSHQIDGAVFKEMRQHNLNGHESDTIPGIDVVVTINYKAYDQATDKPILVFQHVFIGHATTQIASFDRRGNLVERKSRDNLEVVTNIDVFKHDMYADPETVNTIVASWHQEQHQEGNH